MTKNKSFSFIAVISLLALIQSNTNAQNQDKYAMLSKYRNWSISIGPKFYSKARISAYYGDYTFTNKSIPGIDYSFAYDFHPERNWSLTTGLIITKEPVYWIKYRILKKDLYSQFKEDFVDRALSYSIFSFSIPILYRYQFQTSSNAFITLSAGFKVMYYPTGYAYFSLEISKEDGSEAREIFGLNLETQNHSIYESFVLNPGFIIVKHNILWKPNLICVLNFQNIIKGDYQFGNLLSSLPAKGSYKLSGNYIGLNVAISLIKSK